MSDLTLRNGHRMQHPDQPTWCVDCGDFYSVAECTAPGSGRFDTRTETGRAEVSSMLADWFSKDPRHA